MVPQKLNPVYVLKLPVQPVFAHNSKSKLFIEPSSTLAKAKYFPHQALIK